MISAILRDQPRPLTEVNPTVPRGLARLVDRCLAKNPGDRFQSAIDLRHSLEEVEQDVESGDAFSAAAPAPYRPVISRYAAVAIVTLAATAAGVWFAFNRDEADAPALMQLRNPVQVTSTFDVESYPSWSPDGQRLAYQSHPTTFVSVGDHDIWVAQLGSGEPVNLTKGSLANDRRPSWSPNGREIAFFSDRDGQWGVYLVPSLGGSPRKVLALPGSSNQGLSAPQWSGDGTRLFVLGEEGSQNVVTEVRLDTLETSRIVLPVHESLRRWDLSIRPDGRRFAYLEADGGNPELTRLWTIGALGGDEVALTDGRTNVWSPAWSRDGRAVFYVSNRGGSMDLWQQNVADDGRASGEPLPVTPGLGVRSAALSPDGRRLAYSRGAKISKRVASANPPRPASDMADALRITSERAYIEFVDVSPDGGHLAVSSDRRGNQDLWVLPATGGEMTPLTTDPLPDWNPRWSPDGSQIAFFAYRSGNRDLWVMSARGGPARELTTHAATDWFPVWAPSGRREIAFVSQRDSEPAIWIVEAAGGEPRRVTVGITVDWSPNAQWLLIMSQGRQLFRVPMTGGEPVPLSIGDHRPNTPLVSRDGKAIYYGVVTGPPVDHDIWKLSLDGKTSRLTRLSGQHGHLGYYLAADANYLYFTWYEDDGDIWVMDVAATAER